jgi:hypothetical protein
VSITAQRLVISPGKAMLGIMPGRTKSRALPSREDAYAASRLYGSLHSRLGLSDA